MTHFICSKNKLYSSIINTCKVISGQAITYFRGEESEPITEKIADLPESILVAHPRGILVAPDVQVWLIENPQHKYKPFEPDFSLNEKTAELVQISKHLSIYLKPQNDKILWNKK